MFVCLSIWLSRRCNYYCRGSGFNTRESWCNLIWFSEVTYLDFQKSWSFCPTAHFYDILERNTESCLHWRWPFSIGHCRADFRIDADRNVDFLVQFPCSCFNSFQLCEWFNTENVDIRLNSIFNLFDSLSDSREDYRLRYINSNLLDTRYFPSGCTSERNMTGPRFSCRIEF